MKILYIVSGFAPAWGLGGGVIASYELSREMASKRHDVVVYTTDIFDYKTRINYEYKNIDGVKTHYFKTASNFLAKRQFNFSPKIIYYLILNIRSFDVVHIHEYRTINSTIAAYFAKKNKIPYLIQAHGSVSTTVGMRRLKKFYDLLIGNKILKNALKLIALNEMEVGQYLEMGIDKNKILIIPNGINTSKYENLPDRGTFRSKYGIKKDEKIVLYLGRINKIKGIDLLISSFSDLVPMFHGIKLVIAGPAGPADEFFLKLKKQIKDLSIEDSVLITGPLYEQEKLEAYVDADVYVLPSVYDMFPNTVFEACACCIPVILTDRCGISGYIKDKAGVVVEYNRSQLSKALYNLLINKELRESFGSNGRKMIWSKFSWNQIGMDMEDIYQKTLYFNEDKL